MAMIDRPFDSLVVRRDLTGGATIIDENAMTSREVTAVLQRWSGGDAGALDQLTPLVYTELRQLARGYLRRERAGHSLQSAELVNEAFVRLIEHRNVHWKDRAHFFGASATIMRRILVDHARARLAGKRGGGELTLVLDEGMDAAPGHGKSVELLALDDALNALAALDAGQSRIVELRFFGGLSVEETAEVLQLSRATVNRHWATARAWLMRELSRQQSPGQ